MASETKISQAQAIRMLMHVQEHICKEAEQVAGRAIGSRKAWPQELRDAQITVSEAEWSIRHDLTRGVMD